MWPWHSHVSFACEEGTIGPPCDLTRWLSLPATNREVVGHLLFTKDPKIFMITNNPENKEEVGLAIYGKYP